MGNGIIGFLIVVPFLLFYALGLGDSYLNFLMYVLIGIIGILFIIFIGVFVDCMAYSIKNAFMKNKRNN